MAVQVEDIQSAILLSSAYALEMGDKLYAEQLRGCDGYCEADKIEKILWFESMLEHKVEINDFGDETDHLYACLLDLIQDYSGSSISVDPNASLPGTTIVVNVTGDGRPYELTFKWDDFIDNGEDGRIRYENSNWAGWNPILSIDNMPYLNVNVDYIVLEEGGFELLPNGNVPAVYDTQILRAVGYEPTGITPQPPALRNIQVFFIQPE